MKNSLRDYFIQSVLIVFSVLLALFLDEYLNNLRSEKELNTILINIKSEVVKNEKILTRLIPYHSKVLNKIDSVLNDNNAIGKNIDSSDLLFRLAPKGIMQELLSNTAWETAKLNGTIARIDTELLQSLAEIYDQQNLTFKPVEEIIELLYSREFLMKEKTKENLILVYRQLRELIGREKQLAKFLAKVKMSY
jgi:hypothetical protein